MNNTLQLFWSGGLHIAKIFILHKKNIQLTQEKVEPKKKPLSIVTSLPVNTVC